MRSSTLIILTVAVSQFVTLPSLAEADTPSPPKSTKFYRGGDPSGIVNTMPSGNGYASLAASPWKEARKKIAQYCEDPKLIGPYDIETLGQLWIADLHQQQISRDNSGDAAIACPKPEELPKYLNVFDVLKLPASDLSENSAREIGKADRTESRISHDITEKAIALVRCYSHYYVPIKTNGAFKDRDTSRRDALAQQVGDDAVKALEEDYLYGGTRLHELTGSYIAGFRKQRLSSINLGPDDDTILNFAKDFCRSVYDFKPNANDVNWLKTLWKSTVSKDRKLNQTLQKMHDSLPIDKRVDDFAFAVILEQDSKLWQENLPPIRPAGYPPTIGDFPLRAPYIASAYRHGYGSEFQWYQTQLMYRSASRLLRSYFGYKQILKERKNSKSTDRPHTQEKYGFDPNRYLDTMRNGLVSLVGEEAVQQLELSWESEAKSQH